MNPKQQLESILNNDYESEDGEAYKVELLDGMNDEDIQFYKKQLPNEQLPSEIEELLRFARGFQFFGLEEVRFDSFGHFGFEEMFPYSVQLAGDGFGNFWIQDIDSNGNWNSIYFVCHDPPVMVKHAENLKQFIEQVDEFGKKGSESTLDRIHEEIVTNIGNEESGIMEQNQNDYDFSNEKISLPEIFLVADLTDKPIKIGFPWGKFGPDTKIIRPSDKPIWILEKKVKQGFLSKLFGGKNK
jgi:hypothetical protein